MIQNKIRAVIGPKGSGKTYRACRLFGKEQRAILYQPVRRNTEADIFATHISDGDFTGALRELREESYRIVYKVPDRDYHIQGTRIIYRTFLPLLQACYDEGKMTLYVDEAHDIFGHKHVEWEPEVLRLIHLSRNNELSITWMSWGMEAHRDILRATDEFHFFRIWHTSDLDKISWRCGNLTAERVARLQRLHKEPGADIVPGECLVWDEENNLPDEQQVLFQE